jgi:hypothetical protein
MAKSKIARLRIASKAPNHPEEPDVLARVGHPLEVVRLLLAERHAQGLGLDSGEVSSLHHVVSECSALLWNGER